MTQEGQQEMVRRLADRFVETQRRIERPQAEGIAQKVVGDDQILAVARQWLETGTWPAEPEVEGWNPADLARLYRPTRVLTALLWLKEDPEAAKDALKHAHPDGESSYTPTLTSDPVAAGFFSRRTRRES